MTCRLRSRHQLRQGGVTVVTVRRAAEFADVEWVLVGAGGLIDVWGEGPAEVNFWRWPAV